MNKLLVGSAVHYYREESKPNQVNPDPGPDPEGQPLAAIVSHIVSQPDEKAKKDNTETRVNLAVFDVNGAVYGRDNVLLLLDGVPAPGTRFAEWPDNADARKKAQEAERKQAEQEVAATAKVDAAKEKKLAHA